MLLYRTTWLCIPWHLVASRVSHTVQKYFDTLNNCLGLTYKCDLTVLTDRRTRIVTEASRWTSCAAKARTSLAVRLFRSHTPVSILNLTMKYSYISVSRWSSHTNLTRVSSRCTRRPKMNFARRGFRNFSYYVHPDRQTYWHTDRCHRNYKLHCVLWKFPPLNSL